MIGKILDKRYVLLEQTGSDEDGGVYTAYDMNKLKRVKVRVATDPAGNPDPASFELITDGAQASASTTSAPRRLAPTAAREPDAGEAEAAPPRDGAPTTEFAPVRGTPAGPSVADTAAPPDMQRVRATAPKLPNQVSSASAKTLDFPKFSSLNDAQPSAGAPKGVANKPASSAPTKPATATQPLFAPMLGENDPRLEDNDGRADTIKVDRLPDMEQEAGKAAQRSPAPTEEDKPRARADKKAPPPRKKRKTRPPGKRKPKKRKLTGKHATAAGKARRKKKAGVNKKAPARKKKKAPKSDAPVPLTRAKPGLALVPPAADPQPPTPGGGGLSQALVEALSSPSKAKDPADVTQQLELDEMEELVVEPSAKPNAKGRPETRKIEAAWFAEGADFDEESPPDEPPEPGTGDPEVLWSKADRMSADNYRRFSLDLSPPKPPPTAQPPQTPDPQMAGPMVTAVSGEIASSAGPDGPAVSPEPLVRIDAQASPPVVPPRSSEGASAAAVSGAVELSSPPLPSTAPQPTVAPQPLETPQPTAAPRPTGAPQPLETPWTAAAPQPAAAQPPPSTDDPPGLVTRDIMVPSEVAAEPTVEVDDIPLSYPSFLRHPAARWLTQTRKGTFVLGIVVGMLVTSLATCIF